MTVSASLDIQRVATRSRLLDVLLVFVMGMLINGYLIGRGPLAGTEGHRALTAHQMVTSGQWLIPKLYDQYYLRKPPLHYWIVGALEVVTGRANEFIWRIPSAVCAALLAAFLCAITGRWYGRLAGATAGVACCGMLALWGQGRTAEIDSLNTLACVAAAAWLIDLQCAQSRRPVLITIWVGLALGAAYMTKGPAGLAVILAAIIAPPWFNRDWSLLKKPGIWLASLMGLAIFGAYALAVWLRFRSLHTAPDTSGLEEISYNFFQERLDNLLGVLLLPLKMLAFMLPVSLALLPAFSKGVWWASGATEPFWSPRDRRLLRALVGTLIVSCGLTMFFGLAHERYSYIWAPLICPIAGAIAAAWERDVLSFRWRDAMILLLDINALVFTGVAAGVTALYVFREHGQDKLPIVVAVMSGAICIATVLLLSYRRMKLAGAAIVVLILLASAPFAHMMLANRRSHSTSPSAVVLAQRLPAGTTVITGNLLMDKPEVFYYAGMNVKSYPDDKFLRNFDLPEDGWLVLDDKEFGKNKNDPRMQDPHRLAETGPAVFLARYHANSPSGKPAK